MSELSHRAQSLIRTAREGLRPTDADRERVLSALQERIAMAPPASAITPRPPWVAAATALVGVGIVGSAVALWAGASATEAKPPAATPAPVVPPTLATGASLPPAPAKSLVPAPAPTVEKAPSGTSKRPPDRLAEEVAILSQAAKDLRSGRASSALGALNEHQKKFPSGLLTLERRAARAEALCSLGRRTEAEVELASLLRIGAALASHPTRSTALRENAIVGSSRSVRLHELAC